MMPELALSVRTRPKGGRQRATIEEVSYPLSGRTWLIFIHGFNVDEFRARYQWSHLRSLLGPDDDASRVQTGVFLWPSDRYRYRLLSKFAYPPMTEQAATAGRILGQYLMDRQQDAVVLIGHSLGALVALAAADRFRNGQLKAFVLLGAAVDERDLETNGPFGLAPLAEHEAVAYSLTDKYLRGIFKAGEKLSQPFSSIHDAVGLNGEPRSRHWIAEDSRFDHHEYWHEKISATLVRKVMDPGQLRRVSPSRNSAVRTTTSRQPFE
jgi:pimeloyl-ACP methyl ester carboxylesterase